MAAVIQIVSWGIHNILGVVCMVMVLVFEEVLCRCYREASNIAMSDRSSLKFVGPSDEWLLLVLGTLDLHLYRDCLDIQRSNNEADSRLGIFHVCENPDSSRRRWKFTHKLICIIKTVEVHVTFQLRSRCSAGRSFCDFPLGRDFLIGKLHINR